MVHARLGIAEDNSGKLVTRVRSQAREAADRTEHSLILIDGPPGIGCPVIAAITGADLVLVVTEPTLAGRYDLDRAVALIRHFNLPFAVCINKWDLNPSSTAAIEAQARDQGAVAVGRVRYDQGTTAAMMAQQTVVEYASEGVAHDVRELWSRLRPVLGVAGPETPGIDEEET
jgi:MinD superfamily P-loop ATPase